MAVYNFYIFHTHAVIYLTVKPKTIRRHNMKRKFLAALLACLMLISFCACTGGQTSDDSSSSTESSAPDSSSTTTDITQDASALADAIKKTDQYTMILATVMGDEALENSNYYYERGTMEFTYTDLFGDEYTDFVVFNDDGSTTYYSDYGDNTFYMISSTCKYYSRLDYSSFKGLKAIDVALFETTSDGNFTCRADAVNAQCKSLLYDDDSEEYEIKEVFTSLVITLNADGAVEKITASSDYTEEGDKYDVKYELTFEKLDSTKVISLPQGAIEVTDENYEDLGLDADDDAWVDEEGEGDYAEPVGLPTTGEARALVVPVAFTDYSFTEKQLSDLQVAFNGTSDATGWQSVSSYYQISSNGKLSLNFTLSDVYNVNMKAQDFCDASNKYDEEGSFDELSPLDALLDEILAAYADKYDYAADFNANGDIYIDAVYLIYAAPTAVKEEDDYFWWAWESQSMSQVFFGDEFSPLYPLCYVWCGIDTIYEDVIPADADKGIQAVKVAINASTLIHETGHLLGLDDYYDADTEVGPTGGMGGGDMMDYNVGDHCAVSKTLLGWINPTVISGADATVKLKDMSSSGQCIVIKKDPAAQDYNNEYIMIDFYTPTGLNQLAAGYYGLAAQPVVRMYHVDATLTPDSDSGDDIIILEKHFASLDEDIEVDIGDIEWEVEEYSKYLYNNSTTDHKFIKLIEADGDNSIESTKNYEDGESAHLSDYFTAGMSLGADYTWYDGTATNFVVTVDSIDADSGVATISIHFN